MSFISQCLQISLNKKTFWYDPDLFTLKHDTLNVGFCVKKG